VTLDSNNVNASSCLAACPVITISPPTLPTGFVGLAYNQTLTASGGTAPYVFTVTAGTLPAGMTVSSAGVLSGTPTTQARRLSRFAQPTRTVVSQSGAYSMLVVPPLPTLPQMFAILLALGLVAIGYVRLQRRTRPE
jgi:hypothetical protein